MTPQLESRLRRSRLSVSCNLRLIHGSFSFYERMIVCEVAECLVSYACPWHVIAKIKNVCFDFSRENAIRTIR